MTVTKSPAANVIGIDFHTKQLAEEAARYSGMTLRDWLNGVILEKAEELGITAESDIDDQQLEAITARLARTHNSSRNARGPARADVVTNDDQSLRPELARRRPDPREADFTHVRRKKIDAALSDSPQTFPVPDAKLASVTRRLSLIENALATLMERLEDAGVVSATYEPGAPRVNSPGRVRRT
jgi:hypothetical protein